jgi:ketosteroid isomerase-like protein
VPGPDGAPRPISAACHDALPWLGVYRGRPAVKGFLAHMHRNLEVTEFGPPEVVSAGTKAAAFGWFRLHALATGRTVDIPYSILFEVRDGLIVRYRFLKNTFDVAGAFRVGGRWQLHTDGAERPVPSGPEEDARVG